MATIQNQKRGMAQKRKELLMPPNNNPDFCGKSHGYWDYSDPVIPLMDMLSSKAQRRALQKAIDDLSIEELCYALGDGEEERVKYGLNGIAEGIRKKISNIIYKYELADLRFDEVQIASCFCDFGTGSVATLYARRRGNQIVYRCIDDNNDQDEWLLDHYLSVEEVPQYLGLDINYVDNWAIEEIPEILEKKLKDIDDSKAIREGILSCYFEHHGINSDFYPLTDYFSEKYVDAVEKLVSDAVHCLRYPDFARRHYVNENQLPLPFEKE